MLTTGARRPPPPPAFPTFHASPTGGARGGAGARAGKLVTFGIEPERPETGYGYIKRGAALPGLALEPGQPAPELRLGLADAAGFMTPDAVLVLEIGNERAHFEHAFRRLEVAWLDTSAGDDQVLLLTFDSLSAMASQPVPHP